MGTTTVNLTTVTYNGAYAPSNILACWVQDSTGKRVRTLAVYAQRRIQYLTYWSNAGGSSVDGVSGATRTNHGSLKLTWDGKDQSGNPRYPGRYIFMAQMTEANNAGRTISLDVILGTQSLTRSATPATGFSEFSISYTP